MKFLPTGDRIRQAIDELVNSEVAEPARFAVAFWGRFSDMRLIGPCRIICDLQSGACNPDAIEALHKRPFTSILQLKGLHAKVVVTTAGAIVSSANMSTNGLGHNDYQSAGSLEAGIRIDVGTKEYKEIGAWFEETWKVAVPITDRDVARARRLWNLKNQAHDDFDESDDFEAVKSPLRRIDADNLLRETPKPRHRMRAVKLDILEIAKRALPDLEERKLGKIATYACHALLCRSGAILHYEPKGNDPGGQVTEEWIFGRFPRVGPHTRTQVDEILWALSKEAMVESSVREAALQVLEDSRWPPEAT